MKLRYIIFLFPNIFHSIYQKCANATITKTRTYYYISNSTILRFSYLIEICKPYYFIIK